MNEVNTDIVVQTEEKDENGLRDLGRVTKETRGGLQGFFFDGAHYPYNKSIYH